MDRAGITRVANVTGLDFIGVPVYVAVRPNARSIAVSQGKGLDPAAARVSALMEALECWHAETITAAPRRATWRDLDRAEITIDHALVSAQMERPPARDTPLDWIVGHDLLQDRSVWVPLQMVGLDFVFDGVTAPVFAPSTNGLASGNHVLEAVVHGICEIVERDAVSLWFMDTHSSGKDTQVDPASIDDPECRTILDLIRTASLDVGIYDVTSDVGIPTYACVLFDQPHAINPMGYFWGFGCHLAREVALSRALCEAVQCRLTEITGVRDDIIRRDYHVHRSPEELDEMRRLVWEPPPRYAFTSAPRLGSDTLEGDLDVLLGALRRCGIDSACVVDLSKPDVGIAVVKVIIPGLEGVPFEHLPGPRGRARAERGEAA
jgi:ribosomal protein S12 methylthiotransferase accessory factor